MTETDTPETGLLLAELATAEARRILESNHELVASLVAKRQRFENWLHIEIFRSLMTAHPSIEIEKPLPDSRGRCDFWSGGDEETQSWLELKLCVTNYCQTFTDNPSPRPITNQIAQITMDIEKLNPLPAEHARHVLLIAYPLPATDHEHPSWTNHLDRLRAAATYLKTSFSIKIERNAQSAKIAGYLLGV